MNLNPALLSRISRASHRLQRVLHRQPGEATAASPSAALPVAATTGVIADIAGLQEALDGLGCRIEDGRWSLRTLADAECFHPVLPPATLWVAEHASCYERVDTEPVHRGRIALTLADGQTVVWYAYASPIVNAAAFGVLPDLPAAATSAALAGFAADIDTLAAARGGLVVEFQAGTYAVDDSLFAAGRSRFSITRDNVSIRAAGSVLIDGSACTVDAGIVDVRGAGPSATDWAMITGIDAARRRLSVASSAGFAAGDCIALVSNGESYHDYGFSKGELGFLQYAGPGFLYMDGDLYDDYDPTTWPLAAVRIGVVRNVTIEGLRFRGSGAGNDHLVGDEPAAVRAIIIESFCNATVRNCVFENFARFAVKRALGDNALLDGCTVEGRRLDDASNVKVEMIGDPTAPATRTADLPAYGNPYVLTVAGPGSVTISGNGMAAGQSASAGLPLTFSVPGTSRSVTFTTTGSITTMSCVAAVPVVSRWFTGVYDNGVNNARTLASLARSCRRLYDQNRFGMIGIPFNGSIVGRNALVENCTMDGCAYAGNPHVVENFVFKGNVAFGCWQGGSGSRGYNWKSSDNFVEIADMGPECFLYAFGSSGHAGHIDIENDTVVGPGSIEITGSVERFSLSGGRIVSKQGHALSLVAPGKVCRSLAYRPDHSEVGVGNSGKDCRHVSVAPDMVDIGQVLIAPRRMVGGDYGIRLYGGRYARQTTTGTGSAGSRLLAVAAATALESGRVVVIAGAGYRGTPLKACIVALDDTLLTLDRPIVVSVADAACEFQASLRNVLVRDIQVENVTGKFMHLDCTPLPDRSVYAGSGIEARDLVFETEPGNGRFGVSVPANVEQGTIRQMRIRGRNQPPAVGVDYLPSCPIPDDGVLAIDFGGSARVDIVCTSTGSGAPTGSFHARSSPAAARPISMASLSNIVFTTGVLTGQTGADGNFTIAAASGKIYLENRTGATREVGLNVQALL